MDTWVVVLVRYTPIARSQVRLELFIYRCLPTALVTAGIPRTATHVYRKVTSYETDSRFRWRRPISPYRELSNNRYTCNWTWITRCQIDFRFHTALSKQCCSWNRTNIRRHCHARRRLRNFRLAYYAPFRRLRPRARYFGARGFVDIPFSRGYHHQRAYTCALAESSSALLRCPRVKSCCSPTRHKVRQIGTSCDREAAPRMFPLFHRIAPCT